MSSMLVDKANWVNSADMAVTVDKVIGAIAHILYHRKSFSLTRYSAFFAKVMDI
jgi:hypothetical protein